MGDELYERVEAVNIHYLNDKVDIEVIIPQLLLPETEKVSFVNQQCHAMLKDNPHIDKIYLFLKV